MKRAWAAVSAFFGNFRILKRLRSAEGVLSSLSYCEECRSVMLGGEGARVLTFLDGTKHLFCKWCAQKFQGRTLKPRATAH